MNCSQIAIVDVQCVAGLLWRRNWNCLMKKTKYKMEVPALAKSLIRQIFLIKWALFTKHLVRLYWLSRLPLKRWIANKVTRCSAIPFVAPLQPSPNLDAVMQTRHPNQLPTCSFNLHQRRLQVVGLEKWSLTKKKTTRLKCPLCVCLHSLKLDVCRM